MSPRVQRQARRFVAVALLALPGLASADQSLWFRALGEAAGDRFGHAVSEVDDFNGDGYADILVGAYLNDAGGRNAGRAYLFFGGPDSLGRSPEIPDLVLTGTEPDGEFGYSVAGAGDFDGDGYGDIIVGAPFKDGPPGSAGKAYVFFGGPAADANPDLILTGSPDSRFGSAVAGAGNLNYDGFQDVIVGAPASELGAGRAYVFFGGGAEATPDLVLQGQLPAEAEWFGSSLAALRDFGGDGAVDVAVGAPGCGDCFEGPEPTLAGRVYVFSGGFAPDAMPDRVMTGEAAGDAFGASVAGGNVSGDFASDLIVGAPRSDGDGPGRDRGRVYVFHGGSGPDTVPARVLTGAAPADWFGASVTGTDLDLDFYTDVVVGAELNDQAGLAAGKIFGYYSRGAGALPNFEPTGEAPFDHFGVSVSGAPTRGLGPGHPILVVGAWGVDAGARSRGAAYVFQQAPYIPPLLVFDVAQGTGRIVRYPGQARDTTVFITDSLWLGNFATPPREAVPSMARIEFRWHGEPKVAGSEVVAYQYKLDETQFVTVDSSVRSVVYNTGVGGDVITPGPKVFTLRAIDDKGRQRETNRRFQMNMAPDTWFAGPDTTLYPEIAGERYVEATGPFPGSLLSCDSLTMRPAARPARKSFFEIYDPDGPGPLATRVYARSENDTVHMNSWVVFHGGGTDLDSPYRVQVNPIDPALADTAACAAAGAAAVLRPDGLNGSPIGFRTNFGVLLDPAGSFASFAQSGLYPVFDPTSFLRQPTIAGYTEQFRSGKVYAFLRAEDGDGARDGRIANLAAARLIADRVDTGIGTPEEVALRSRILTFYVNKAPFLRFEHPAFVPAPNQVFPRRGFMLNLVADDLDPLDLDSRPFGTGAPSSGKVLRRKVTLSGRDGSGAPVSYSPCGTYSFDGLCEVYLLPANFVDPNILVEVELCDCLDCEAAPGTGRCVRYTIPIRVPPPPAPDGPARGTP